MKLKILFCCYIIRIGHVERHVAVAHNMVSSTQEKTKIRIMFCWFPLSGNSIINSTGLTWARGDQSVCVITIIKAPPPNTHLSSHSPASCVATTEEVVVSVVNCPPSRALSSQHTSTVRSGVARFSAEYVHIMLSRDSFLSDNTPSCNNKALLRFIVVNVR